MALYKYSVTNECLQGMLSFDNCKKWWK